MCRPPRARSPSGRPPIPPPRPPVAAELRDRRELRERSSKESPALRLRLAAANPTQQAAQQPSNPAPFPPLSPDAQAKLQQLLDNWERTSQGTKTLECKFKRWHFDMFAAPSGVAATKAEGVIKYAAPDKGLFRVDALVFFAGNDSKQQPQYKPQQNKFGEHWVCNGQQLIEFDRTAKECRVQELPPQLQGQKIFNSPLPFVFNLNAKEIVQRYWVRQVQAPKPGIVLVEAWPKLQEDRAQYKLVQIALNASTFLPEALIMYAPNFNAKTAPKWDHYEFVDVKRNGFVQGINNFLRNFIPQKPPADWTIHRDRFQAPTEPVRKAEAPATRIQG